MSGAGSPDPKAVVRGILAALAVTVPVALDPGTRGGFNVVKIAVLLWGACAIVAVAGIAFALDGQSLRPRTGVDVPVAALLVWTAAASVAGLDWRFAILGAHESYDGLALATAVIVVFFACGYAMRAEHVKTVVSALFYGAGGIVVVYGLVQLHDTVTTIGGRWDPVAWEQTGIGIASTLANPNHLGAFIATIMPLGAVLFVLAEGRRVRIATGVLLVAGLPVLVQTSSRGALAGAATGALVLTAALVRDVLRAPRVAAAVAAIGAAIGAVVVAALAATGALAKSLDLMLAVGLGTSVSQRTFWWRAAVRMALDRPAFGFGPDSFRFVFPAYITPDYVRVYGTSEAINGPHNFLLNALASTGWPGLALLVAVVGLVAWRGGAALRHLRRRQDGGEPQARELRLVLAGTLSAFVVAVVQSLFNIHQVTLAFVFWLLAGLVLVVARAARASEVEQTGPPGGPATRPRPASGHGRRTGPPAWAGVGVTALVLVAAAFAASGPWRADRHFQRANFLHDRVEDLVEQGRAEEAATTTVLARDRYLKAQAANPWEATLFAGEGLLLALIAESRAPAVSDRRAAEGVLRLFRDASAPLQTAVARQPRNGFYLTDLVSVRLNIVAFDRSASDEQLPAAVDEARRAVAAQPWRAHARVLLSTALLRSGQFEAALREARAGLDRGLADSALIAAALSAATALERDEEAAALREHLESASVEDAALAEEAVGRGEAIRRHLGAPPG